MILIELLVATTLISLVMIGLGIMRKMRDRKAAAEIITKIKEDEARRTAETKKVMLYKFGFEDGEAEKIAVRVDRAERIFYQSVINMYLQRDASALEGLNISFESSVEPYRTLEPKGGGSSQGGTANESEEIQHLKEENARLSEEISVTMQTMGRMLSEYSTMFGEKAKEQEESIKEQTATEEQPEPAPEATEDQTEDQVEEHDEAEEVVAEEAVEESEETKEDPAKEVEHLGGAMVEEMDDLSDLDPEEDKDLKDVEAPDNPDELIG
jgi:hypothetical protein